LAARNPKTIIVCLYIVSFGAHANIVWCGLFLAIKEASNKSLKTILVLIYQFLVFKQRLFLHKDFIPLKKWPFQA